MASEPAATGDTPSVYRFRSLDFPGMRHGITGRHPALPGDGDVSYFTGPGVDAVRANRAEWARQVGVDATRITCGRQVHRTTVRVIREPEIGRGAMSIDDALPETDSLVTNLPGVPLMVGVADCVPILMFDPVQRVVAAVHAGWRGTVADIAGETVRAMVAEFGSDPADLRVGLGPSIGPCCYEVGPEVIAAWHASALDTGRDAVVTVNGRVHFDLWRANTLALTSAGAEMGNIENAQLCTRCHADRFFSRRARVGHRGLFGALIALANDA